MTAAPNQDEPAPKNGTTEREETTVGNYFVANYPPFSFWQTEQRQRILDRLDHAPDPDTPFGLYIHIPFCRKRCDFCYFRVYTDNDAKRVRRYIDGVITEMGMYAERALIRGRKPQFVYFGGGTPSYLSVDQMNYLFEGLQNHLPWDGVEEVTFECEPGTLQEKKIRALRELGVTRLSLGVENFNADILELNNRAHRAKEIDVAYDCARDVGFPQINIDLIAGMVGETEENWRFCIDEVRKRAPESITIYQMEVPYNTTIYQRMKDGQEDVAPIADWATKRRWVDDAFQALAADGYQIGSAYTAKKGDAEFLYRDGLWRGADMLGIGVASFSHLAGIHFQNEHDIGPYHDVIDAGGLPIHRALELNDDEKLIREFILQLKFGEVGTRYFTDKFGVDVTERFAAPLQQHAKDGYLRVENDRIELTRAGLLQVDRLLYEFFLDEHRGARYA